MNKQLKYLAYTALFLAAALIIGVAENFLPPLFPYLPFVKIGFGNIVIIFALIVLGWKPAFIIAGLKSVLVPLFVGNPIMIAYSLPATLISITATYFLLHVKKLGIPSVSVVSAIIHTMIQLCVAALMTGTTLVFGYTPYLVVIAALSGFAVGLIATLAIKRIPFFKKENPNN